MINNNVMMNLLENSLMAMNSGIKMINCIKSDAVDHGEKE
jgi:hypothetical protein